MICYSFIFSYFPFYLFFFYFFFLRFFPLLFLFFLQNVPRLFFSFIKRKCCHSSSTYISLYCIPNFYRISINECHCDWISKIRTMCSTCCMSDFLIVYVYILMFTDDSSSRYFKTDSFDGRSPLLL